MEKLDDGWALYSVDVPGCETLGNQGVYESWKKMLLIGTEGGIQREQVHTHASTCLDAFLEEELSLSIWFEVWGNVNSQSPMGFLKWLLDEFFRLACWCGSDGECSQIVQDSSHFVDVDKMNATFGDGE